MKGYRWLVTDAWVINKQKDIIKHQPVLADHFDAVETLIVGFQSGDVVKFTCKKVPTSLISMNILILN